MLLEMSDGNGLGDGWPPLACRPVCLFSRTFLVLASFVGSFGCVLSLQRRFGPKYIAVVAVRLLRP